MKRTTTILLALRLASCGQPAGQDQSAEAATSGVAAEIDPELRGKTDRFVMRFNRPE